LVGYSQVIAYSQHFAIAVLPAIPGRKDRDFHGPRVTERTTINMAVARRMARASAILGASIVGRPGGWSVPLKLGAEECLLGTHRDNKPRLWRSLDRCIEYVRTELGIPRFDSLDATHFQLEPRTRNARTDTAQRMRQAHEAITHDQWFRGEVEKSLIEANDPATFWVSHENAKRGWVEQRALLANRAGSHSD
jgi:hypothetical protein